MQKGWQNRICLYVRLQNIVWVCAREWERERGKHLVILLLLNFQFVSCIFASCILYCSELFRSLPLSLSVLLSESHFSSLANTFFSWNTVLFFRSLYIPVDYFFLRLFLFFVCMCVLIFFHLVVRSRSLARSHSPTRSLDRSFVCSSRYSRCVFFLLSVYICSIISWVTD